MKKEKRAVKEILEAFLDFNLKLAETIKILAEEEEDNTTNEVTDLKNNRSTRKLKGLAGIAEVFQCSIATASRIKQTGILDGCISQVGRTFVIDESKALEFAKLNKRFHQRVKKRKN